MHAIAFAPPTPAPESVPQAQEILRAAEDVYQGLGPGFDEGVYATALSHELHLRAVPHLRQVPLALEYKGVKVGRHRLDLLVDPGIVVQVRALPALHPHHTAQLAAYLRASGQSVGLLINFNGRVLRDGVHMVFARGNC